MLGLITYTEPLYGLTNGCLRDGVLKKLRFSNSKMYPSNLGTKHTVFEMEL